MSLLEIKLETDRLNNYFHLKNHILKKQINMFKPIENLLKTMDSSIWYSDKFNCEVYCKDLQFYFNGKPYLNEYALDFNDLLDIFTLYDEWVYFKNLKLH